MMIIIIMIIIIIILVDIYAGEATTRWTETNQGTGQGR